MVKNKKRIIAAGIFSLVAILTAVLYGYIEKHKDTPQHGIMVKRIGEYEI